MAACFCREPSSSRRAKRFRWCPLGTSRRRELEIVFSGLRQAYVAIHIMIASSMLATGVPARQKSKGELVRL